ncbi:putative reverse transcriptase domain-containing protein [Tanacetum coccineum]
MKNEQVYAKTRFAPHRIPQSEGNHNGWLSVEEEADLDSESTASNGANGGQWLKWVPIGVPTDHFVTCNPKEVTSFIGGTKLLTCGILKVQARGLVPEIRESLKATQPATIQSVILKAGILTDEAVSNGTLTKGSEKRKSVDEPAKVGGSGRDVKKAKGGTNFVTTAPSREGPGHFARDCHSPAISTTPVNVVDARPNQRECYECGGPNHLRNVCPKEIKFKKSHTTSQANAAEASKDSSVVTGLCERDSWMVEKVKVDLIDLWLMDWLSHNKAMIVCHEKVVEIPLVEGEILRVHGERVEESTKGWGGGSTMKKSKFVEVFPDDLKGLPPQRQVEFHIELIPRATPVAKSPYCLVPSEMQELSEQLKELQATVSYD